MLWLQSASLVAVLSFAVPLTTAPRASAHDREFWQAIARDHYQLPKGESAIALMRELSESLGSPDPELRDDLAYSICAQWIYRQRLLERDGLVELEARWMSNLKAKIGQSGDDSVFLRSFSALCLSILAALDNDQPFLTPDEHSELVVAARAYLAAERDLRDFERDHGWIHATAHTADLLKFVARSPHFKAEEQGRVLAAISDKLANTGELVFTHGEEDRLARVILSIVLRADFDAAAFDDWLAKLRTARRAANEAQAFDPVSYAGQQNRDHAVRSLYVLLSCLEAPAPAVAKAREQTLAYLRGLN